MTRPLRIEYPGAVYHITSRGNEKKAVFKDDQDRENFLNTLQHVNKRYNWLCHAYCLMTNHYHLLIETPDGNLSLGMRQLNGVYTQLFNKRHKRNGHLFQGRFKGILIQKDSHLLEVCRYVVLNPLRAGMVESPEQWKWSSYRATAGREKPHPSLTTDWILGQFGGKRARAEQEYRQFVKWGIDEKSIMLDVKGQVILGEDEFVNSLADHLKKHKHVPEIPKSQRYANRPTLDKIFNESILKDRKKRDKKMVEAIEKFGYRQSEIARHLQLHTSTVSNLVRHRP
jgi:REP element-mobilizing transposase RayT/DNA-binding CsgD family transcriptional regulator